MPPWGRRSPGGCPAPRHGESADLVLPDQRNASLDGIGILAHQVDAGLSRVERGRLDIVRQRERLLPANVTTDQFVQAGKIHLLDVSEQRLALPLVERIPMGQKVLLAVPLKGRTNLTQTICCSRHSSTLLVNRTDLNR